MLDLEAQDEHAPDKMWLLFEDTMSPATYLITARVPSGERLLIDPFYI
jgi:hypothetical protein